MKDYRKLQNGSDIRGIAMENETGAVNLTKEAVRDIAAAFAVWLRTKKGYDEKKELRIAVGRDSRLSGETLVNAVLSGLTDENVKPVDFALASTPAMFMSTVLEPYKFDGSIMITASHLPWYRNGMKFFTDEGGTGHEEIEEIIAIAEKMKDKPINEINAPKEDFMKVYTEELVSKIRKGANAADYEKPLKGLHIIVDAGNGAGGFFVDRVLKELGADTEGSRFLEPDGRFPNHIPNPENKEAARMIKEATIAAGADLGIIFDTDVDRAGAVLKGGKDLTGNALIAVLSKIAIKEHPGTTIVTDSVTSTGLAKFIKENGGIHRRFKRGYKNVIDEAIRLNEEGINSELAIETSGHGAFKENYFIDDGAYLMAKLLIEMGRGTDIKELVNSLKEPEEAVEIRFPVTAGNVSETSDKVLDILKEKAEKISGWETEKENFEGIRINCNKLNGNGWFLLRKSLHEPIMPLNIESDEKGGSLVIAEKLKEALSDTEGIDKTVLDRFIEGK